MRSASRYLEVFEKVLNRPDPGILSLWYYCKRIADEYGVPDIIRGNFPDFRRDIYEQLWELRNNLENHINADKVKYMEKLLKMNSPEELYSKYLEKDNRRAMGEFFTPVPIARRMVSFSENRKSVFDIGVGTGIFLREAARLGYELLMGIENSPILCDIARYNLKDYEGKLRIIWGDFLVEENLPRADLWISNPPYTRHHQLPSKVKEQYIKIIKRCGHQQVSRLSSLYVLFFIKILCEKSKWLNVAYICPRSLYDSVHSYPLKKLLIEQKTLTALEIFHEQRIFEDAETGPVITYLDARGSDVIVFRNCLMREDEVFVLNEKCKRLYELDAKSPWTNIAVNEVPIGEGVRLGEIFTIMRGVATGANDYFVLTHQEVLKHNLPSTVLLPAIAKTRYCLKEVFTKNDWERLKKEGKEVYLLDLSKDEKDPSVQRYLRLGVKAGIPNRSLVKTRKKWYYMEKRPPPPIFVTYLSRGRPRFILNEAKAIPLNVFLCLYPKTPMSKESILRIWRYLNSEEALKQFNYLARNYGENTLKIEPRILDLLAIPREIIEELNLSPKNIDKNKKG